MMNMAAAPLVAEGFLDLPQFGTNQLQQQVGIFEDRNQSADDFQQLLVFVGNFLVLEAGQLVQPHVENFFGLFLGQLVAVFVETFFVAQ